MTANNYLKTIGANMLRSSTGFVSKQVEQLINQISVEDKRFERELRSVHREKLIIPAEVMFDSGESLSAFTRNISSKGVCIMSCQEIEPMTKATLKLFRMSQAPGTVLAECRWSKPFGDHYWVSGWLFLQVTKG